MPLTKSDTGVVRPTVLSSILVKTGELFSLTMHFFARFWRRPFEFRELIRQLDEIGSKSVILTAVTGLAIGIVLANAKQRIAGSVRRRGHDAEYVSPFGR